MAIVVDKKNGLSRLRIEGEMTISTAQELKGGLLDNLEDCSGLEIDLSGVNEFDTAGFQLLFLTKREANMSDKSFRIISHSPASESIMELYSMKDYFDEQNGTASEMENPETDTCPNENSEGSTLCG
jgi:anti-anti-sigma factor